MESVSTEYAGRCPRLDTIVVNIIPIAVSWHQSDYGFSFSNFLTNAILIYFIFAATSVIVKGARCKKWHKITKSDLNLESVSKACNISKTCLLQANRDLLKLHGSTSSPLQLLEKAVGKYLDMGCFYPSQRPLYAKF